jgi:hypothetical protein
MNRSIEVIKKKVNIVLQFSKKSYNSIFIIDELKTKNKFQKNLYE